jgi:hypothetical protein
MQDPIGREVGGAPPPALQSDPRGIDIDRQRERPSIMWRSMPIRLYFHIEVYGIPRQTREQI